MLIFSSELINCISKEFTETKESVKIISAFCKKDALKLLNDKITDKISEKILLVRFTLDDIISGASDLEIYEFCKSNNWRVYVRFDLHAKMYIFDNLRCILGSANLTSRGIASGNVHNIEVSTLVELNSEDQLKISNLIEDSILMTDDLYNKMCREVNNFPKLPSNKISWSVEIMSLLNKKYDVLFTHHFPSCSSPFNLKSDSLLFLELYENSDLGSIKKAFIMSAAFLWLCEILSENNDELYFGSLTEKLHKVLVNDPVPYRKEVKTLLSNLLNWIVELDIEEIKIDRPNYSERITLISS